MIRLYENEIFWNSILMHIGAELGGAAGACALGNVKRREMLTDRGISISQPP